MGASPVAQATMVPGVIKERVKSDPYRPILRSNNSPPPQTPRSVSETFFSQNRKTILHC